MSKIEINDELYAKLKLITNFNNEDEVILIENLITNYLSSELNKISKSLTPSKKEVSSNFSLDYDSSDFYAKAIDRIPIWARKKEQYNHKILRAYFKALKTSENVTISNMELLCSDENNHELYVPTFRTNYAQMKIDGPKSHGKVFEDDGKHVYIWSGVKSVIEKYKEYFM